MRLILLIVLLIIFPYKSEADNNALLVGVGNYPSNSGWCKISSVNDVDILSQALSPYFKVRTLIDEKASYEGIKSAFNELIQNSKLGDTIYVHFSGHGQQVLCSDKDEVDYLDEALVPYDAFSVKSDTYLGKNHLLDDEFGSFLINLRRAVGPSGCLIVTLDACYSDSMDKGEKAKRKDSVIYRGGEAIFGSNYISMDSLNNVMAHQRNRDNYTLNNSSDLSDVVIISACMSHQKNMEVKIDGIGYGSLSYSIYQSLNNRELETQDLKSWIEKVLQYMSVNAFTQNPQVRTTIDYQTIENQSTDNLENKDVHVKGTNEVIYLIISVAVLIAIIFVWKKRKK